MDYLREQKIITEETFKGYQSKVRDCLIIFDSLINQQVNYFKEQGQRISLSMDSPRQDKVNFIKALLKEHNPSEDENKYIV